VRQAALLLACILCLLGATFAWLPLTVALGFPLGTAASFALLAIGAACGFAAER
jgi:hypothetical protein